MKLPRFTLRDLFWLVLVAGLGLGWWAKERRHEQQRQRSELLVNAYHVLNSH